MAGLATGQVLRFPIFVDPDVVTGYFDQIEVWRSRTTEAGPYEEITDAQYEPADHTIVSRPYYVDGKQLKLQVGEQHDVVVTFSGTNPISASTIASQIQAQSFNLLRSYVLGSEIIIETAQPGAAAVLRVVSSDAAAILGLNALEPEALAFGHDVRIPIIDGIGQYTIVDPHGSSDYFYKTRYRNRLSAAVSDFSDVITGESSGVDPSKRIRGYVKLVDVQGRPLSDWTVLVSHSFHGEFAEEHTIIGSPIQKLTDSSGEAEFWFLRGLKLTVALAGTQVVRDITVPSDPTVYSFNLLAPEVGSDDVFVVQVPQVPWAERRSL